MAEGSILTKKPRMIRYHDLTVKLYKVGDEGEEGEGGIFRYNDPFLKDSSNSEYPIKINKIVYTSDATPSTLTGSVQDIGTVSRNVVMSHKGHFIEDKSVLQNLTVGCGITVELNEDNRAVSGAKMYSSASASTSNIIFKGYICSISRQFSSSGIVYNFEARDVKYRLTYQTIKKVYNGNYKNGAMPIVIEDSVDSNSQPVYTSERLTVYEILKDIINYSKKTSSYNNKGKYDFVGFDINDFDFNGDNYLKYFIPQTISFDNVTIFEAIYRLINSAGPYRMVVEYKDSGHDKIYFSRLDSKCKYCGKEINLYYGSNSKSFDDVNVISDTTVRKIYDACSIMKSYSGPIDWYSGHFFIKMGEEDNDIGGEDESVISCRNWDGYNYYFGIKSLSESRESDGGDSNSEDSNPYVIVGAPLYPAWEPWKGYEAFSKKYSGYMDSVGDDGTYKTVSDGIVLNYGITENDIKYIKHRNFTDAIGKDRMYNAAGLSYVAYVPYGECEYCNGTGAVDDIDDYSDYEGIFGKTRNLDGDKSDLAPGGLDPFDFGSFQRPKYESSKDIKYHIGDNYTVPQNHPVPWKNTCPVCRGTGMEPWFKMGTILNSLIDISPSQVKIGERGSTVGLRMDKTYSQIAEDMSYKYQAVVHVETNTSFVSYAYPGESNSNAYINHPLFDTTQIKELNTGEDEETDINSQALVFPDGNDGSTRANDEDSKYVHALYYTQIQEASGYSLDTDRSLVIFNNSQFISYSAPMSSPLEELCSSVDSGNVIVYDKENKHFLYNGKGTMGGIGQYVGSFWRPARAWITCYFKRDRYECLLRDGGSSGKIAKKDVTRTIKAGSDTDRDTYTISARIEDNRYCAEIVKKDNQDNVEEYHLRPIARAIFCDDFKWQLHPWDIGKYNIPGSKEDGMDFQVPSDYSNSWGDIFEANKSNDYCFPCGKIMKFEPLRDVELNAANSGALKSDVFGKVVSWVHKDDRMKLFEKACAEFERRNNIQISGTVTIKGEKPSFNKGLGWVKLFDGQKACIVKEELSFDGDFTIELEVGTEELRVGQKREKEIEYDRLISDAISGLNLKSGSNLTQSVSNGIGTSDVVTVVGPLSFGNGVVSN